MLSEKLNNFLEKWVDIENLILWDYHQEFLEDFIGTDFCTEIPLKECETNVDCTTYKNAKCVNKSRKKNLDTGVTVSDKQKNEYTFLDYIHYEYDPLDPDGSIKREQDSGFLLMRRVTIRIFKCYIFQQKTTKDIFLLFSIGNIYSNIYTNEFVQQFINLVMTSINEKYLQNDAYENIILCGHSQGCVIAQFIGLSIMKQHPTIFVDKCWIIGSGPFHWINREDVPLFESFSTKIAIFVLICTWNNHIIYDPFSIKNYFGDTDRNKGYPLKTMYFLQGEIVDGYTKQITHTLNGKKVQKYVTKKTDLNDFKSVSKYLEPTSDAAYFKNIIIKPILSDEIQTDEIRENEEFTYPVPRTRTDFHLWFSYRRLFYLYKLRNSARSEQPITFAQSTGRLPNKSIFNFDSESLFKEIGGRRKSKRKNKTIKKQRKKKIIFY
jgi:hypothetical protein